MVYEYSASEQELLVQVRQVAGLYGWMVYHTHDSRRSDAGFPDLVLVRPPRLIFAELKSEKGRIRNAQKRWLMRLGEVSELPEVYLWRPDDWPDVMATLSKDKKAVDK